MPLLIDDLQFTAPGPQPSTGLSATVVGIPGITHYWYWMVIHYAAGACVVGPVFVSNAPTVLTAGNYVQLVWNQLPKTAAGAFPLVDILRMSTPQFPTVPGNYAATFGTNIPSYQDNTQLLYAFDPTTLTLIAPATAHIHLNNRDYSIPTIEIPVGQMMVNRIQFPDGSGLTSASSVGAPGGPNGSVQFNNNGVLGGSSNFTMVSGNPTVAAGSQINVNGLSGVELQLGCFGLATAIVQSYNGSAYTQLDLEGNSTVINAFSGANIVLVPNGGRLLIGEPNTADDGTTLIQGHSSSVTGTVLVINCDNPSGGNCQITLGSYSGGNTNEGGVFQGRTARGTSGTPAALQASDALTVIEGVGYNGVSFPVSAVIGMYAESNWTPAPAQPAFISFSTISTGSLTERMRITSSGNVGIGTTTPAAPLDVLANAANCLVAARAYGGSAGTAGGLFSGYSARGTPTAPTATQISDWLSAWTGFGYDGSAFDPGGQIILQAPATWTPGNSPADMLFFTNPGTGGLERMTITHAGSVGIGTAAPTGNLHVYAATGNTQVIVQNAAGTTDTGIVIQDANREWKFGINIAGLGVGRIMIFDVTSGLARLEIDAAGNIYLPALPAATPGAGTKALWYDPANSNQVKFAV